MEANININNNQASIVRSFLLVGGVEVVAKSRPTETGWVLTHPLKHLVIPIQIPGPQGIQVSMQQQFVPLVSLSANDEVTIPDGSVMFVTGTPKRLEDHYLEITSGIQIAPASSIIQR